MRPIYTAILLIFVGVTFSSCNKDKDTITRDATLYWTGDVALDGCGFIVEIAGTQFKAENESIIVDSYKQQDQTEVVVEYKDKNTQKAFPCGFNHVPQYFGVIELISIKRK